MSRLRHFTILHRCVLAWFLMSLGVAVAAPVVHPQAMELVCSAVGTIKVIVQSDDGAQELGASHLDCPLCVLSGVPPVTPNFALPTPLPLARAVQSIPAAHIAAATAAPLPARGPPVLL